MRIRTLKTKSGSFSVQVVSKQKGKLTVHKHIGSYRTEKEKARIIFEANLFIKNNNNVGQQDLWEYNNQLHLSAVKISQSQPLFLYRLLGGVYEQLGLGILEDELIKDLILARIYQPVSKRETKDILSESFGKSYSLKTVYRHLKRAVDIGLKQKFQTSLINFARESLHDPLRLVFYDVTTLAFASQAQKGIKDFGFSKDYRFQDVQIVVGLVVNRDGFPIYFDVFQGNTFEGNTFLTVINNILSLLESPDIVVIADSAMLSKTNLETLAKKGVGFIVGARMANLPSTLQEKVSRELSGVDRKIISVGHSNYRLVCQYSSSRAAKDRSDREKQIARARMAVSSPGQVSRRFRFLKKSGGEKYEVNKALVEKAKKLEGIKGYLTNTILPETVIIERYHDLWKIEKSFRITKSDLQARPIFLQLDKTITAHLIIVFAALAITRYLEFKTGMSIQRILKVAQKVLTHKVTIKDTGAMGFVETTIEDPELCGQLEKLRTLGH